MAVNKFGHQELFGSVKDVNEFKKSGTHVQSGRQFLNEHKKKPQMYRMSSQPSQAHIEAMELVENQALQTFEAEIKRLVERPEPYFKEGGKNFESTMIEAI